MIKYDRWIDDDDGEPIFWIKNILRLFGWTIRLHKFVKADAPGCFHTHPALAYRIILWGGYVKGTWQWVVRHLVAGENRAGQARARASN